MQSSSCANACAPSATLAQRASFRAAADVRNLNAQRRGQIDLMILLLHEDLANLFRHREFSERFALPDAIAIIANGFIFVVEVEPQHIFRTLRRANGFGVTAGILPR